jgi:hypothetical protein
MEFNLILQGICHFQGKNKKKLYIGIILNNTKLLSFMSKFEQRFPLLFHFIYLSLNEQFCSKWS